MGSLEIGCEELLLNKALILFIIFRWGYTYYAPSGTYALIVKQFGAQSEVIFSEVLVFRSRGGSDKPILDAAGSQSGSVYY